MILIDLDTQFDLDTLRDETMVYLSAVIFYGYEDDVLRAQSARDGSPPLLVTYKHQYQRHKDYSRKRSPRSNTFERIHLFTCFLVRLDTTKFKRRQ